MSQLHLKLNKLRSMSAHEIASRVRSIFYEWFEYICFRMKMGPLPVTSPIKSGKKATRKSIVFDQPNRYRFFTELIERPDRRELIDSHIDATVWVEQANKALSGPIPLLGVDTVIPFSGGWHIDPLEGESWPDCFYAHVKKHDYIKNWDIKYIWEVNRHQYLIVLGKAFWLTGDERYAEKIVSAISTWIDENPYNMGVNWTSSLELAVRTISWIWSVYLCMDSVHMTGAFQEKLFTSIVEQARYIETHLSHYSSPFNHLIGEAAALHLIGCMFPEANKAKRWERLGWSIMADTVDKQFHEDGMSVEQASFYHHFTLGFYLQAVFLRRHNRKKNPQNVLNRIEKALEFSLHLTMPDGTLPMIGDIDNARSLYFNLNHNWDFRSFLGLGAVLFNRPDFKKQSTGICEEMIWLTSRSDIDAFSSMKEAPPSCMSTSFPRSGYYISRSGWQADANYLCFDCGEIAAGLSEKEIPSAAHGHADALSFSLVANGKPFITDGGFYTYFGDLAWHRYFRHEEAHNTVLLGKHRQATYCGRLTWKRVKNPEMLQWEQTKNYDVVAGKLDYGNGQFHLRQMVSVNGCFWYLRDRVNWDSKTESISSFLHFSPQVGLQVNHEARELIATNEGQGLLIKWFGSATVETKKGGDDAATGWVAYGYGIKHPAWLATFRWESGNPQEVLPTLMVPFKPGSDVIRFKSEEMELGWPDHDSPIEFSINGDNYSIAIDSDNKVRLSMDQSHKAPV